MKRIAIGFILFNIAGAAMAQAPDCANPGVAPALSAKPTLLPSLAAEIRAPGSWLASPSGVLAQAPDESQTVDQVLYRLRLEGCANLASVTPPGTPGNGLIDPATYKPKTEFDNTPWRFNMSQNGKQMTADEFSAWMKARGVRVATGAKPAAAAATGAPGATPAAPGASAPDAADKE